MKLEAPPLVSTRDPELFRQRLHALTPRARVTSLLVGANILVLAAMGAAGIDALTPEVDALIRWGANYGPRTSGPEPYRLLTSAFLHGGVVHIGFNMLALYQLGQLTERLFGGPAYLVLYLLSAAGGSLASVVFNPLVISVGASGAIFGVFAAAIGYLLRERVRVPPALRRALWRSAVWFGAYAIGVGLVLPQIDNAAHLGGAATGLVCGMALALPLSPEAARVRVRRAAVVGLLGVGAIAALAWAMPPGPPDPRVLSRTLREVALMDLADVETYRHLATATENNPHAEPGELRRIIDEELLPRLDVIERKLVQVVPITHQDRQLTATLLEHIRLVRQGLDLLSEAVATRDADALRRAHALLDRADALLDGGQRPFQRPSDVQDGAP